MLENTQPELALRSSGIARFCRSALGSLDGAIRSIRSRSVYPSAADYQCVEEIREFGETLRKNSDEQLRQHIAELRLDPSSGEKNVFEQRVVPAFALVNEAARRTLRIEYYDVQFLAGLVLARQSVAEMKTGEGKTLVAALPAVLFSLAGRGVHVMTANAYLAERDCASLEPLFGILGISVGHLDSQASPNVKQRAYARDITYGPGYEFGFDYLRDQAALLMRGNRRVGTRFRSLLRGDELTEYQPMQRSRAYAIVDEIDSVLIDDANSPLMLSEGAKLPAANAHVYVHAEKLTEKLVADEDYILDTPSKVIQLTANGAEKSDARVGRMKPGGLQRHWNTYVEQALRARFLFKKDVDYIVRDDEVVLVDASTGRIFADRTLRDGLHQAIEAKEELPITAEQQPLARISRQRFIRLYEGVCGMTGTTDGIEREFWEFYRLPVVLIPLRNASQRTLLPTRFFADESAKLKGLVDEVQRIHQTGQPILVGTRTIETSQMLAERFDAENHPYKILNGVQDADEATIVAEAGKLGAVTIATNMAGRGTDIKLGPGVAALGGLHVLVTEPNDSSRVDRQLMGRCARQGDPGSCQTFVSADDPLIKDHGVRLRHRMQRLADERGEVTSELTTEMLRVQARVERQDFVKRRRMFAQDDWLDQVLGTLAKEN